MKAEMMKFWKDEDGATALEYGLIAGIMVVAVVAAFTLLGNGLEGLFTEIKGKLTTTPAPAP